MGRIFGILIILITGLGEISAQRNVIRQMRLGDNGPDSNIVYAFSIPENEDYDYFVGAFLEPVSYLQDVMDNDKFYVRNDSLFTRYSFDYESPDGTDFYVAVNTPRGLDTVHIEITDVTGKWDENGYADKDLAAKYEQVNKGDYIYFERNNSGGYYDNNPEYAGSIQYPNKILIHGGKWAQIQLYLDNVSGVNTKKPIVITNFLGQVVHEGIRLWGSPNYIRLTGQYDPVNKTGHRYYTGTTDSLNFSQETFGILGKGKWGWEDDKLNVQGTHAYAIETTGDGIEVDHVEATDGFFSGINFKKDNAGDVLSDSCHVHHIYMHDVGSEGGYFGNTKPPNQQIFTNFKIHHNAFIRCGGEGSQWQRVGDGFEFYNNVHLINAMDWKSPFQRFQDGMFQEHAQGGRQLIHSNLFMVSGEGSSLMRMRDEQPKYPHPIDTIFFYNNYISTGRGDLSQYIYKEHDNKTSYVLDSNFYRDYTAGNINEVYNAPHGSKIAVLRGSFKALGNNGYAIIARNNKFDTTFTQFTYANNIVEINNQQFDTLPRPQFVNFMGSSNHLNFGYNFDYTHIERYTNIIGEKNAFIPSDDGSAEFSGRSRKGYPAWWDVGDVVQYWNSKGETRFYVCVKADSSFADHAPSQDDSSPDNAYWKMLIWQKPDGSKSYYPPDNVKLKPGSFYEKRKMGL